MGKAPHQLTKSTKDSMRDILASFDSKFHVANESEWGDLVNYSDHLDHPIHRWFRNREGYSIRLVQKLLEQYPAGSLVADPFCGTGTTPLAALLSGYRSVGTDVNPLATFIAKVKTRKYNDANIERFGNACSSIYRLRSSAVSSPVPQLKIIDKAFQSEILNALLVLKYHINERFERKTRDFFFAAWLSILEEVSNVYREGNGIKYRNRKRTKSGYVTIPMQEWEDKAFPDDKFRFVKDVFLQRVRQMMTDVPLLNGGHFEPEIYEGDALSLDDHVQTGSASLVAFSPPYANNFNYFKAYKIELWMGDFVSDYEEIKALTKNSLRSHVETQLLRENDSQNWYPEEVDLLLDLIDPEHIWTNRIPKAVKGYFYDMHVVLEQAYDALAQNGQCVIVVGNSAYGGVLFPTDSILAQTASSIGFDVEKIAVARHLTTSSQQKRALEPFKQYMRESLVFLRKNQEVSSPIVHSNGRQHFVSEIPKHPKPAPRTVYVIRNHGLTDYTHIIHKYPGKFIPHIPRWAMQKYLPDPTENRIFDPFCGSGTSLVEANLSGNYAFGIDINPLARLISKVKTTPIPERILKSVVNEVAIDIQERMNASFVPDIENLDHWFNDEAIRDLGIVRDVIDQYQDQPNVYDFLLICFSAIIRKVSNADNQSIKTYVSHTHPKTPPPVIPLFVKTLKDYAKRVMQFSCEVDGRDMSCVLDSIDARNFAEQTNTNPFGIDLAITSPPYVKTVDYVYSQMVEFFWIGDRFGIQSRKSQNSHKREYIGSEQVYADQYRAELGEVGVDEVDKLARDIHHTNAKHGYIVHRYFADMRQHFSEMRRVLPESTPYVVVVGNSMVSDHEIETHKLLEQCASLEGFSLEGRFAYEIRNRFMRFPRKGRGGIVDLDWVITLR